MPFLSVEEALSSISCNVKRIIIDIDDFDIHLGEIFSCERRKMSYIVINDDYTDILEDPILQNDPYFLSSRANLPRQNQNHRRAGQRVNQQRQAEQTLQKQEETTDQCRRSARIKNMMKRRQMEKEQNKKAKVSLANKKVKDSKKSVPAKRKRLENQTQKTAQNKGAKKPRST